MQAKPPTYLGESCHRKSAVAFCLFYANSIGADRSAYPRSHISYYAIRCRSRGKTQHLNQLSVICTTHVEGWMFAN